jgi:hypothetical protein
VNRDGVGVRFEQLRQRKIVRGNFAQGVPSGQRLAVTRKEKARELRIGKLLQNMSQPG